MKDIGDALDRIENEYGWSYMEHEGSDTRFDIVGFSLWIRESGNHWVAEGWMSARVKRLLKEVGFVEKDGLFTFTEGE